MPALKIFHEEKVNDDVFGRVSPLPLFPSSLWAITFTFRLGPLLASTNHEGSVPNHTHFDHTTHVSLSDSGLFESQFGPSPTDMIDTSAAMISTGTAQSVTQPDFNCGSCYLAHKNNDKNSSLGRTKTKWTIQKASGERVLVAYSNLYTT